MATTRFSIDAVFKAIDRFSAPVGRMTTSMGRFARTMKKGMHGVQLMTKRVVRSMKSLALSWGTIALMSGFGLKGLLGTSAEFEKAMAGVNAVTMGTIKNMKDLKDEARRLGKSTVFTATEVAGAMEVLGRAGLSEAGIRGSIEPILNAAAAEGAAIEETANVIMSTMKGFDLPFTIAQTTRVADVLALTSSKVKTTINELGEGLAKAAPIAHQFNMSWEEITASIAALQDVGIEASMSGTQLRTMLTRLAALTPKAAAKFKELGIEIDDGNGNMKQMSELILELVQGLQNTHGNMAKVKAITDAVGLRGQVAANILTASWDKASGSIKELLAAIEDADGAAKKMADLRMDNVLGDIEELKGAWEDVKIAMGLKEMPAMRRIVQDLTEWLRDPATVEAFVTRFEKLVESIDSFWRNNKDLLISWTTLMVKLAELTLQIIGAVSNVFGPLLQLIAKILTFLIDKLMGGASWLNQTGPGRAFNAAMMELDYSEAPGKQVIGLPSTMVESGANVSGNIVIYNKSGFPVGVQSETEGFSIDLVSSGVDR